ncbi:PTS mannose/fructose/sorbose/N-acetylgalactosamine transporter subunit IIC [Carnobacterium maltaromaticum]|uniref:PTS mannose/fructose/sorbose/N-acetylgalactosamine transporter subunit IIC n=1 Tax=Carnobacterium maltaromaticum TaxID=2751 RepID=UPI00191BC328|nr:PTS mannose/fructose/sorbose/N-acetylgalactosamine transporter subunit IIC [Carnobacterium maltaromaticum]CAD5901828.1 PTS system protein [Carnobacterium maltaromaticum]
MIREALLAAISVFICYGGNYIIGQGMLERPIVVGAVTGLLLGDLKTGVLMGAALEAVFMGNVNIGGVISAEPVTATAMATTFAIISTINQEAAITLAIPIGMLTAFVVMFLKNVFFNVFAPPLDQAAAANNQRKIVFLHWFTWFLYYLIISLVSFFGILAGSAPVQALVDTIPQNLMNGLSAAGGLLPAVGFAMLMKMLWDNKLAVFYILGFVLTAYLEMPAVAVAAIGIVICVASALRDKEVIDLAKNKTAARITTEGEFSESDSEEEEEDFFS